MASRPLLSRTRALLPFSLVLLSLLSLAGLHLIANRKTGALRNRISRVTEPSRALVTEIQSAIALETAAARGYLLARDFQSAAIRANAKQARTVALSRLLPFARQMGPEVTQRTNELNARLRRADLLLDSLFNGSISGREYLTKLEDEQDRFRTVLASMSDLDNAIAGESAKSLSNIRTIERTSALLTALFVFLALVAALLVERLGRGYRVLLEELSETEERFRQIVEAIHDFVWLSDSHFTKHFYANAAYERIWGRARQRLYENPYALLDGVHPEDVSRVSDALNQLPHGEYDIEFRVIRPDGEQRWVWSRGFPVRNERGLVYRIAGISEDITERKLAEAEREHLLQSEREARSASDEARAAAEARREEVERVTASRARLIRGFTHDVKNPLGAADGFLALLEDGILGELKPKQLESVHRVRRSIGAALGLIGYLLDLARAEAGQLEIHRDILDLGATAREVSEDFRAEAESKQLSLALEETGPESLTVCSDHARVRQVLSNLISNAVKYTQPGGNIRIRVQPRSKPGADNGEWVAIDVADDGPGIAPEQQPRLFDEFARFDPTAAQGSGIGLAISERVARALDGAITVISEVGVGSTFTLWLPQQGA
jgi:PAS domain S-box-containing protein